MRLGRKGAPEMDKPLVWGGKGPLQIGGGERRAGACRGQQAPLGINSLYRGAVQGQSTKRSRGEFGGSAEWPSVMSWSGCYS
jgi:hypothetical protein